MSCFLKHIITGLGLLFTLYVFADSAHDFSIDRYCMDLELGHTAIRKKENSSDFLDFLKERTVIKTQKKSKKLVTSKHIRLEFSMPEISQSVVLCRFEACKKAFPPSDAYRYLFFKEINPPPPRLA